MTAEPTAPPAEEFLRLYRCQLCRRSVDEHTAGRGCEWIGISPLFAWGLESRLEIQSDQWISIAGDLNVPPVARPLVHDSAFCARMRASAEFLAEQLAAGKADSFLSRCTADEVNLAMALDEAVWVAEGDAGLPVPNALRNATVDGLDADCDAASEMLFQDHDVFMLWNPSLDGIERDDDTLAKMGISGLHPSGWFEPFNHAHDPIA